MSTIGSRLREERERLGLNQAECGRVGGVGKQSQLNYEADKRIPGADYLARVAHAGVDVLYVVLGRRDSSGQSLTKQQRELLEGFASLSERDRAKVAALVRMWASDS